MRRNRILIIDGSHLLHRNARAMPDLEFDGISTGGIHGFLMSLLGVHERWPGRVYVAWEGRNNWRRELLETYKRKGKLTEEEKAVFADIREQGEHLRELLGMCGTRQFKADGFEADDTIGTIATMAQRRDVEVFIFSGDSDLHQLVGKKCTVIAPGRQGTETVYSASRVTKKHGVGPELIADLKALAGDTSDNIPGVKGVGPKTAAKLLNYYGCAEEVVDVALSPIGLAQVTPRIDAAIKEVGEDVLLYKKLATIRCDAGPLYAYPTTKEPIGPALLSFGLKELMTATRMGGLARLRR